LPKFTRRADDIRRVFLQVIATSDFELSMFRQMTKGNRRKSEGQILFFPVLSFALCLLPFISSPVQAQQANAARLQRYAQEGEQALAENRYDDAARAFEKLRELAPGMAEAHARLGLIYYQQGKFEQAAATLRQALKLKPTLPNLDVLLAMSLSELGKFEEALPGLQKGFKRTNDAALKRSNGLQLLRAYTGLQQDDKAVEVALELTRAFPKDPETLYHAARLFGNYAYLSTVKLAQVAPDSLWVHLAAGEANESQGKTDLALREYRQALALDPRRPGIHFRLGRVLLARAQTDATAESEALKEFAQELQLDPTNANAAYEIGEIHRKAGELEKAREFFALAIKHYPDFEEALVGLGRALVSLGQAELALNHLRQAVALNPNNEVTHYQLAQAYRALGNTAAQQQALAEYQRLQSLNARRNEAAPFARREATKQELDSKPQP
jgi:tetratricopeptide (TPR) repeat protein